MAKLSQQLLTPNPFETYRDPQTGMWIIVPHIQVEYSEESDDNNPENLDRDEE